VYANNGGVSHVLQKIILHSHVTISSSGLNEYKRIMKIWSTFRRILKNVPIKAAKKG